VKEVKNNFGGLCSVQGDLSLPVMCSPACQQITKTVRGRAGQGQGHGTRQQTYCYNAVEVEQHCFTITSFKKKH